MTVRRRDTFRVPFTQSCVSIDRVVKPYRSLGTFNRLFPNEGEGLVSIHFNEPESVEVTAFYSDGRFDVKDSEAGVNVSMATITDYKRDEINNPSAGKEPMSPLIGKYGQRVDIYWEPTLSPQARK